MGATLGGGVSASQGHAGLLIDLLHELQIVTALSESVTASRTQNSDLSVEYSSRGKQHVGIRTHGWILAPQERKKETKENVKFKYHLQ